MYQCQYMLSWLAAATALHTVVAATSQWQQPWIEARRRHLKSSCNIYAVIVPNVSSWIRQVFALRAFSEHGGRAVQADNDECRIYTISKRKHSYMYQRG